jgi:predicted nucleotidyltransferase component of viral defense system
MANNQEYIEQFHLLFLDHLGRKLDKRLYALKGGCNLRFYFKSMRYSEDIDLDAQIIQKETLYKNVQNILESKQFQQILKTRAITIANISNPKQTETTQRWKVMLQVSGALGLHTKIEFSRRNNLAFAEKVLFETVDHHITALYHLPPILLNHYKKEAAIVQKIEALANRTVTQARDIFDLYLLIGGDESLVLSPNFKKTIQQALENISIISYHDFLSQVVAYLEPGYQRQYTNEDVWEHMVEKVQRYLNYF